MRDVKGAQYARRQITRLYQEFEARQLPLPEPEHPQHLRIVPMRIIDGMTLEERVDRIERHLHLGKYS